jgi:muramoyltetrapeptide carboxypeptidase
LHVLRKGDLVRLVSPASYPDREWLDESTSVLQGWGLRVDVGAHAMDRLGFCAGTDDDRLSDLDDAYRDPDVRAIITTRGGAGAYRIADRVDFAAVRADPKPLVGFSDITHLHLALWKQCGLPSIHGALAGPTAEAGVRQLLMTTDACTARRDPDAVSARVLVPGRAAGPLLGGNLTALATSVGVNLPPLAGSIVFMEDLRHKGLGFVDRLLTQLVRSGALDGIHGIALGSFEGFRDVEDRGWTVVDVLRDRLGDLGVPVLGGIRAGHDLTGPDGSPDQVALPLGTHAELDADAGTLEVASPNLG